MRRENINRERNINTEDKGTRGESGEINGEEEIK
jgi:hypothetical protein